MSNSLPGMIRDAIRQEAHYRVRRCMFEIQKLMYDARNRKLDALLPALHQAYQELKAIDLYDSKTDLKEVEIELRQKDDLMNSTLEVLEGDLWRRNAKWQQTHLQVTLCRLIKEAYFEGAIDRLQALIHASDRTDAFDVNDPNVIRSTFDAEVSAVRKFIGNLVFKEATDVE